METCCVCVYCQHSAQRFCWTEECGNKGSVFELIFWPCVSSSQMIHPPPTQFTWLRFTLLSEVSYFSGSTHTFSYSSIQRTSSLRLNCLFRHSSDYKRNCRCIGRGASDALWRSPAHYQHHCQGPSIHHTSFCCLLCHIHTWSLMKVEWIFSVPRCGQMPVFPFFPWWTLIGVECLGPDEHW